MGTLKDSIHLYKLFISCHYIFISFDYSRRFAKNAYCIKLLKIKILVKKVSLLLLNENQANIDKHLSW